MSTTASLERRFQDFVVAHRQRAVETAWRLVGGDMGAAEDVAQEAFVRAWRALPKYRGDAALSTWFYRILVRQAANHRRWKGTRDRWHQLAGLETERSSPPPRGDAALRGRIEVAVGSLSKGQREVFVLVHMQGFTVPETAEILGKAPGTVKSHLHRSLTALRSKLSDCE